MFVIIFAAAFAAQEANPTPAPLEQWTEIKDETEGFSLCYPSEKLSPAQSERKSDGLQFVSKDGAKLKFWSREDNRDKLLSNANKDLDDEVKRKGGKFTFNSRGGSIIAPWDYTEIALNGRTDFNLMRRWGTRVLYMRLSVPSRLVDTYGPIADRLVRCFKPTLPG
jgi:hypothetical protein